jgi:hypothetical protein
VVAFIAITTPANILTFGPSVTSTDFILSCIACSLLTVLV